MASVQANLETWRVGEGRLDVLGLYDELERRYGADTPTNYAARLLAAVMEYEAATPDKASAAAEAKA